MMIVQVLPTFHKKSTTKFWPKSTFRPHPLTPNPLTDFGFSDLRALTLGISGRTQWSLLFLSHPVTLLLEGVVIGFCKT
jgi:hypothetical protein